MATSSMQVVMLPPFTVIGPTVRTTNAAEMSADDGEIGPLWSRFMGGQVGTIPKVIEQETIYAVYSQYESDETGPYDLTLGKSVELEQEAPANMKALRIPSTRYMIFPLAESSPSAVKDAWTLVYTYFAAHRDEHRAFTFDLEQHSAGGARILIALK